MFHLILFQNQLTWIERGMHSLYCNWAVKHFLPCHLGYLEYKSIEKNFVRSSMILWKSLGKNNHRLISYRSLCWIHVFEASMFWPTGCYWSELKQLHHSIFIWRRSKTFAHFRVENHFWLCPAHFSAWTFHQKSSSRTVFSCITSNG